MLWRIFLLRVCAQGSLDTKTWHSFWRQSRCKVNYSIRKSTTVTIAWLTSVKVQVCFIYVHVQYFPSPWTFSFYFLPRSSSACLLTQQFLVCSCPEVLYLACGFLLVSCLVFVLACLGYFFFFFLRKHISSKW